MVGIYKGRVGKNRRVVGIVGGRRRIVREVLYKFTIDGESHKSPGRDPSTQIAVRKYKEGVHC